MKVFLSIDTSIFAADSGSVESVLHSGHLTYGRNTTNTLGLPFRVHRAGPSANSWRGLTWNSCELSCIRDVHESCAHFNFVYFFVLFFMGHFLFVVRGTLSNAGSLVWEYLFYNCLLHYRVQGVYCENTFEMWMYHANLKNCGQHYNCCNASSWHFEMILEWAIDFQTHV